MYLAQLVCRAIQIDCSLRIMVIGLRNDGYGFHSSCIFECVQAEHVNIFLGFKLIPKLSSFKLHLVLRAIVWLLPGRGLLLL
jgi:hypothetical protein